MFVEIPTYEEAEEKREAGTATPLDTFILNQEVAGYEDNVQWRTELINMLQWVVDTKPFEKD